MLLNWHHVARPAAVMGLLATAALTGAAPAAAGSADEPAGFTIQDPGIAESSGLAASQRHENVYWTHNDSGYTPAVYAIDGETGETLATITLQGVEGRDMEAISVGPRGDLYVGDIGDNFGGQWPEVWIYRLPEPENLADATIAPTVYRVQYEDGPRDAEALMIHPVTGRAYIVDKKEDRSATLYAGPEELTVSGVNTFTPVAEIDQWVTDGAFSPDGTRLILRGYFTCRMYRWSDADGGTPDRIARRVSMPLQRQGESVTFTPDGRALMFGSEGVNSVVEPSVLQGDLLPESVQREDERAEREAEEGGRGGSAAGEDGEGLSRGTFTTLAAGILLILAVRHLVTRGRKG
ncbi:hypothetical protein [Streptomyces sp. 7-21]|jgi:DNA-binding beta-propeller fold protein YncE|uniref:hypothetical protein n=1 Tax=Streptomyces sp. 7-21 TaxID=2802283 RepID=UPI001F32B49B|nr:hypothetical protein [Streptomyces sp. 7-21]